MKGTLLAGVIALLAGGLGVEAGELCIAGNECRQYSCGSPIAPASERRAYTYAGGTHEYHLGELAPNDTMIACGSGGVLHLTVKAAGLDRRNSVQVTIRAAGGVTWPLQVPQSALQKGTVLIHLRRGSYEVSIVAPHFRALQRTVDVQGNETPLQAVLLRLPILEGTVVDGASRLGVAGARITTDVDTETIANAAGYFSIEADPDKWPKSLTVHALEYAASTVAIPPARASTVVGEVAVHRGGSVVVVVDQPSPEMVVEIALQQVRNDGRSTGRTVESLQAPNAAGATLRFENVEPGQYLVVAKGKEEWQRLAEPVLVVKREEAKLELHIAPFRLRLRARRRGEALPDARVVLKHRDGLWEAKIQTDNSGDAVVHPWQSGRFNTTVEAKDILPYIERRTLIATDTDWFLDVPLREITGVVVDAGTGDAIPRAGVALSIESEDGYSLSVKTQADDEGVFAFSPVPYGHHTIKAAAAEYAVTEMSFGFSEPHVTRHVPIRLERASAARITVTDSRDAPIRGATVLDFVGLTRRGVGTTDPTGTAAVMAPAGESRDAFIIPRDGSFGIVRVTGGAKSAMTIPDGVSRIVLRARAENGEPIAGVSVVVRFNGRVLPYEVVHALGSVQGSRVKSDATGQIVLNHVPTGVYEFWPGGSAEELRALAAGVGPAAPVRLVAAPGENLAVMTFATVAR